MGITKFQEKEIKSFLDLLGIDFNVENNGELTFLRYDDLLTSVKRYREEEISKEEAADGIKKYRPWVETDSIGEARKFITRLFGNKELSIIIATDSDDKTPAELYMIVNEHPYQWFITLFNPKGYASKGNPYVELYNGKNNTQTSFGLTRDCSFGNSTSMSFLNGDVILDTTFDRIEERDSNGRTIPYLFGNDCLNLDNYKKTLRERITRWNKDNKIEKDILETIIRFFEGEVEKFFADIKERPDYYIARLTSYRQTQDQIYEKQLTDLRTQMSNVKRKKSASREEVENGIQLVKRISELS